MYETSVTLNSSCVRTASCHRGNSEQQQTDRLDESSAAGGEEEEEEEEEDENGELKQAESGGRRCASPAGSVKQMTCQVRCH